MQPDQNGAVGCDRQSSLVGKRTNVNVDIVTAAIQFDESEGSVVLTDCQLAFTTHLLCLN